MATSTLPKAAGQNAIVAWLFSSIGKKLVVSITGAALALFAIGHLAGNMTFFVGEDAINAYAVKLHSLGPILWVARIGLLVMVGLHIYFTMLLWKENSTARPSKYEFKNRVQSTIFARTMRLSGLIIFAFVIFHLAHFTWRFVDPAYSQMLTPDGHLNVFKMLVVGFSSPLISGFYIISLGLLAFHLSHGLGSLFQTLGITNRKLRPLFEVGGRVIAWGLFIGFSAIPVSVLLGYGKYVLN